MKKGICGYFVQGNTVYDKIDVAHDAGYDGIEITVDYTGEVRFDSTPAELKAVCDYAKSKNIEFYSLFNSKCWDFSLVSENKEHRGIAKNNIIKQLEVASYLGCDTILVVPGAVGVDFIPNYEVVNYDKVYQRSLEAIGELAPYAEKYGVYIGVENVHNKFLLTPGEFNSFIEKINSEYVAAYLDVGNTLLFGYPDQWIRTLGDKIKKVHFKDYSRESNSFVGLLEGDVDYPEVMKAFKEIGYDDYVTAEIFPNKHYGNSMLYPTSVAMDIILKNEAV